jgi:hypothetical protein
MTNTVETTYAEFVESKRKDPQQIADELGSQPSNCDAVHMAMGVVGEAIELLIATDLANTLEELGDLEFYLTGFENLGWVKGWKSYPYSYSFGTASQHQIKLNIIEDAGTILDLVKKATMYQKDIAVPAFSDAFRQIHLSMEQMYVGLNYSREEVLQRNVDKLNKRYAKGYSDKAAQDRADKV